MDIEISTPQALIARINQEISAVKKNLNHGCSGADPNPSATAAQRERLSTLLDVLDWIKTIEVDRAKSAVYRALGFNT